MTDDEARRLLNTMKVDAERIIHELGRDAERLWELGDDASRREAKRLVRLVNYAHVIDDALPTHID